jgi:hypothetical protein
MKRLNYMMKNKQIEKLSYNNTSIRLVFAVVTCIVLLSLVGCDDTTTNSKVDNVTIPSSNVSYSKYIQPVLSVKCTYSGCHDDNSKAGGISLTSWSGTTSGYKEVIPGSSSTSPIVWAVNGSSGKAMPPTSSYPAMTSNQVSGLKVWIDEGAKNN